MCAPLLGSDHEVHGVLYVDNQAATHQFGDEDLDFLVAFSGIGGVAIENSKFAERIRKEALVRSNFERYFAPSLAARIASSPDAVRLGGDKRPIAVLFSDIRGFTALSENMNPDEMATLLTEYFTEMVDCVFRHGGTLDKFIGDAVMAQWGAPIASPDDADHAMTAALDMMRELDELNKKWRTAGRPDAADRHRPQLRRGVRRQHRLREAAGVHRHRRCGEYREPPLFRCRRGRDPAHRRDAPCAAEGAAREGARAHGAEGQGAAGTRCTPSCWK